MAVPISNVTRRVVFEASGTGPYAFTFEILANTDIAVYEDDTLLTLTTDYTVTINTNGTGSVTLVSAPTGDQIAIVGNRTISRTTDFVTGGDFFANTINSELDQQTIFAQQNAEGLLRALQAPQTDPTTIDMTLPRASVRANKTLAFDTDGNPVIGEQIGDYRGNWASGTAYNKRDIVKDSSNSNIYYCATAHTSTGTTPISSNTDSAKWTLIVDAESASDSADAAATSATAAATSATNAASSASSASSSASSASTSAGTATTKASDAATSATAAASSASTASTAATNAGNSATAAATSATNASNSASAASTSASNASSSASAASTSASNASTSATNAASSATSASSSASTASTQATNAATSATNAAASETAAAASATSAAASFDSFDDRYLGAKSSDPSVDNDGNALVTGAMYFNSTVNEMRVRTSGAAWAAAYVPSSGYLTSGDIGSTVQAYDADLTAWSGVSTSAKQDTLVSGTNIKTINGTTVLGSGNIVISTGSGATATAPLTLTSSSATFQYLTSSFTGAIITLPDATTLSTGPSTFSLHNASAYVMVIKNSAGTLLGFIKPGTEVVCSLSDNSTAAGTWGLVGASILEVDAQGLLTYSLSSTNYLNCISLSETKHLLTVAGTNGLLAFVYDDTTGTFGTIYTVDASNSIQAKTGMYLISSSSALLVYGYGAFIVGVVLTVSGTTITATTSTQSTTGTMANGPIPITKVTNGAYVLSIVANNPSIIGLAVSGGTVVWANNQTGTAGNSTTVKPLIFEMTSNEIMVLSQDTTFTPYYDSYSVGSNGSLTFLSTANINSGGTALGMMARKLSNGKVAYVFVAGATYGGILSYTAGGSVSASNGGSPLISYAPSSSSIFVNVVGDSMIVVAGTSTNQGANVMSSSSGGVYSQQTEWSQAIGATTALLGIDSDSIYFTSTQTATTQVPYTRARWSGSTFSVSYIGINRSPTALNLSVNTISSNFDTTVNGLQPVATPYSNSAQFLSGNSGCTGYAPNLASSFKGLLLKGDQARAIDLPLSTTSSPGASNQSPFRQSGSAVWAVYSLTDGASIVKNLFQRIKVV